MKPGADRSLPLVTALVMAVLLAGCRSQAPAGRPVQEDMTVPVAARPAETGGLRAVLHTRGIVTPSPGAELLVTATEPARVLEVLPAQGDTVAPGDILVRFDMPGAAQALARQRAEVARLQALLESARVAQARTRDFVDRGLVPRRDIDTSERELADAQAAVTGAERARSEAEAAAAHAVVRATFAGLVAQRFHDPGDVVQGASDPILRIVDPRRLQVDATITAADAARVLPGASARLAGPVPLRLTVLGRDAPAAGSTDARVRLAFVEPFTASAAVAVDTPVDVDIDAEARANVVFVAPGALVREGAIAAVYVASGGVARRRPVTTGVEEDERVEIVAGVKAGELVITRGQAGLADGAAITVDVER